MGLRFRRRVRIFPGFYLNLSKSGLSATVGMRGMSVNLGENGAYLNAGIPGTGIYAREKLGGGVTSEHVLPQIVPPAAAAAPEEIKSFQPEMITSEDLFGLKESILNAQKEKQALREERDRLKNSETWYYLLHVLSRILIFGFVVKWFKDKYEETHAVAKEASEDYENFGLKVDVDMDADLKNEYISVTRSFDALTSAERIWDVITTQENDRIRERTVANSRITRQAVSFSRKKLDFLISQEAPLFLQNANGDDIYIYPGFMVMTDGTINNLGLVELRDISITHHGKQFIESENVPQDAKVVGQTWKYTNKNGSPDRRYRDNYEIPIALYYEMTLKSSSGVYESYMFSNAKAGLDFCAAFEKYQVSLRKLNWKADT